MNKLIKAIILLNIVFFLSLYLSRYNNSYIENNKVLTNDAIKQFENDLKSGKKINPKDYLPKEKDYNNKASLTALKISNFIEISFKKSIKIIINYLDDN